MLKGAEKRDLLKRKSSCKSVREEETITEEKKSTTVKNTLYPLWRVCDVCKQGVPGQYYQLHLSQRHQEKESQGEVCRKRKHHSKKEVEEDVEEEITKAKEQVSMEDKSADNDELWSADEEEDEEAEDKNAEYEIDINQFMVSDSKRVQSSGPLEEVC